MVQIMPPSKPPPVSSEEHPRLFLTDEDRWAAITRRDSSAEGAFFYSTLTTGIYCRPGCPSRPPSRENVRFHRTREDAEKAGYRPCRRCRPNEPSLREKHAAAIARACALIAETGRRPSIDTLAKAAGMSRFHFHRIFKRVTGMTPKAYATRLAAGH